MVNRFDRLRKDKGSYIKEEEREEKRREEKLSSRLGLVSACRDSRVELAGSLTMIGMV